jgi:hypothetical protein
MSAGRRTIWPAVATWLILAATASAAGMVRELWLRPRVGERPAHQLGTLLVCVLFVAVIGAFVARTKPSVPHAAMVGAAWLAAAVVFEFALGRWLDGLSWSRLLADYDLRQGRLLLLVWFTVAVAPPAWAAVAARRRAG